MDELVQRLSTGNHPVTAGGPNPSVAQFKQSIDREYVHIKFTSTRGGTDVGVTLDPTVSQLHADFQQGVGTIHIEGTLTLNYVPVRCVADIDLATLNGTGHLVVMESQPTA